MIKYKCFNGSETTNEIPLVNSLPQSLRLLYNSLQYAKERVVHQERVVHPEPTYINVSIDISKDFTPSNILNNEESKMDSRSNYEMKRVNL